MQIIVAIGTTRSAKCLATQLQMWYQNTIMAKGLNSRQEAFCRGLAEGLPQSRAYIQAGYGSRGNAAEASDSQLLRNPKVAARVAALRADAARRSEVTLDSLVGELDAVLAMAVELGQPAAGVSAIMGKARLLGLIVDRSEVVTTIRKPAREATNQSEMSLEEWQAKFGPRLIEH
jgi:hypothetical protein